VKIKRRDIIRSEYTLRPVFAINFSILSNPGLFTIGPGNINYSRPSLPVVKEL